jgi:DNA-binding LacI/PurR family transcriptional regulator
MSREAGRLVVDLVSSPEGPFQHVVLPTSLVRRRTLAERRD